MGVHLNHTIVHARDKRASAVFMAELLGLPDPVPYGPFECVTMDNDVSLDFDDDEGEIARQHYAFLVTEDEFDAIFGRIEAGGLSYWADPGLQKRSQINHHDGGRGVYFCDLDGHLLEIITRPYGMAS
jgi:catechol 2,3-dioxygenase-like lactoylglutathione lyase family enzyme